MNIDLLFAKFPFSETMWLVLVSIAALGLCVAGLALNILVRKNGKFPETEVGKNKHMRKLGITCVKQEEMKRWKKSAQGKDVASDCGGCTAC
ncbi:MAG: hypothetical protein LBU42_04630 [Prevotellaceae bacterium]|jgi:hypothetical protein|nr:hypothetical protein [Prevotellaceae bacterium]